MYFIRVTFNDRADDQILQLPAVDLEQAERFAGELRHEVEEAREIGAPVVEMTVPGDAGTSPFEPGRITGIDLEEEAQEVPDR